MQELNHVLEVATAAVEQPFILLPIDGGPAIYRERVYCYELYHQMRTEWPDPCPYTLNGEVQKGGHPILRRLGFGRVAPDLLVHGPGAMAGNHAVIEIKSPDVEDVGMANDLGKLNMFVMLAGYRRAIYLIYDSGIGRDDEWIERVRGLVTGLGVVAPIELWLHRTAGRPAQNVHTFRPAAHNEGQIRNHPG